MGKVYVETYGCTSNKFDSEKMIGLLNEAGYKITSKKEEADYLLVNTCAVKSTTEEKIIHRLKKLSESDKKLIVAGCLTKVNSERIKRAAPEFSAMIDPRSIHKIVDVIRRVEAGSGNIIETSRLPNQKPYLPRYSFSDVISIIKLSEGCASRCTFCATKLARGDLVSYRPEIIRESVADALRNGAKEIQLTSEDTSAYGRDIGTNLSEILNSICKIPGSYFIRVGMMNPLHLKSFLDSLMSAYKNPKVFKFLHIPVQSGSDKLLKLMRRGYNVNDYLFYVDRFREEIPDITISTDIIVGFPSETNSDFNKTVKLIKKVRPDVVNLSKYSVRPNTEAAKMKKLDTKIVDRRSNKIHKLIRKISRKNNEKWIGWEGRVLIDEYGKNKSVISRNCQYKPIVTSGKLGTFKHVKITSAEDMHLVGK